MKIESQIHLKLVDAVTKYFGKMLSHRQKVSNFSNKSFLVKTLF